MNLNLKTLVGVGLIFAVTAGATGEVFGCCEEEANVSAGAFCCQICTAVIPVIPVDVSPIHLPPADPLPLSVPIYSFTEITDIFHPPRLNS